MIPSSGASNNNNYNYTPSNLLRHPGKKEEDPSMKLTASASSISKAPTAIFI
jgi:hypothetical protein